MRTFEATEATRAALPLLIGLTGASGSGKTYSALRLATGIRSVCGGEIFFVDTENKRACHYAPEKGKPCGPGQFAFRHIQFDAPYSPLDYLSCLKQVTAMGAKVIVVDSMSHEHEGPGGLLESHDKIVQARAGDDYRKAQSISFSCWAEPKAQERALLNAINSLGAHVILCFRAKEKTRPPTDAEKARGVRDLVQLGWQPIASPEFVYELSANALLAPGCNGVPTWECSSASERIYKRPEWALGILKPGAQLTEEVGASLARWASGGSSEADVSFQKLLDNIASADEEGLKILADQLKIAVSSKLISACQASLARKAWSTRSKELASTEASDPNPAG